MKKLTAFIVLIALTILPGTNVSAAITPETGQTLTKSGWVVFNIDSGYSGTDIYWGYNSEHGITVRTPQILEPGSEPQLWADITNVIIRQNTYDYNGFDTWEYVHVDEIIDHTLRVWVDIEPQHKQVTGNIYIGYKAPDVSLNTAIDSKADGYLQSYDYAPAVIENEGNKSDFEYIPYLIIGFGITIFALWKRDVWLYIIAAVALFFLSFTLFDISVRLAIAPYIFTLYMLLKAATVWYIGRRDKHG